MNEDSRHRQPAKAKGPTAEYTSPNQQSAALDGSEPLSRLPIPEDERYSILGERARGGLGRILDAHDERLDRPVAVKELLRQGGGREVRFVREALITARLQHPSIVPVHDLSVGRDGEPFYVMKVISGRSLRELIPERPALRDRLALLPNVIAVADAVAYAHSQRIIHRDLKPANVVVGPFGETVVVDWGLASDLTNAARPANETSRVYEKAASSLTVDGAILGTAEYMPLEQGEGRPVDERADVYAIGAMLYHLLTGRPPYQGHSSEEVMERLLKEEPVPLDTVQPKVPRELATIVRKAMARRAEDRYPTAKELAEDLKRFQTGQLVSAYDYSMASLVRRWAWRNRLPLAIAAVCLFALASLGLVSVRRIVLERDRAERQRSLAEARRNEMLLMRARALLAVDPTAAVALLKQYPDDGGDWRSVHEILLQAHSESIAKHVFKEDRPFGARGAWGGISSLSPDGKRVVTPSGGWIHIWNTESGEEIAKLPHEGPVRNLRFSPEGHSILAVDSGASVIHLWDIGQNSVLTFSGHDGPAEEAIFSPDGKLIASGGADGTVRLWSVINGEKDVLRGNRGAVFRIAFSPNQKWLASTGVDTTVTLWNLDSKKSRLLQGSEGIPEWITFSPDSRSLAVAGSRSAVRVWDLLTGAARVVSGPEKGVNQVAYSPNGGLLGSTANDGMALWNLATGEGRFVKTDSGLQSLAFSPSGALIATGGSDGALRIWDVSTAQQVQVFRGHAGIISGVEFASDGRTLVSIAADKTTRPWSVPESTQKVFAGHQDAVFDVAFSPDGSFLASASRDRTVRIVELSSGDARSLRGHEETVYRLAFSPDGKALASACLDRTVRLWDLSAGTSRVLRGHEDLVWDVQFSPDGNEIASGSADGTVRMWNTKSGEGRILRGHEGEVRTIAFSRDGKLLASGGADRVIRLWDVQTGAAQTLDGHGDLVYQVVFSPDGTLLASASFDKSIRVWNLRSGGSTILMGHTESVRAVAFSPGGRHLASAGEDAMLRIWDIETGQSRELTGHNGWILQVLFSPNGRLLASASYDKTVRVWDALSGTCLTVYRHDGMLRRIAFSPSGTYLASGGFDRAVRLWPLEFPEVAEAPAPLKAWMNSLTTAEVGANGELVPR